MSQNQRKISQSSQKAGTPFAELNCKEDDFVKVVHRGIESSKVFQEAIKEYEKYSEKERKEAYKEASFKLEAYPLEIPSDLKHPVDSGTPDYYIDNMSQETINILNAVHKMSDLEKAVVAIEKIKERFFAKDDTQANWTRLLAVWLFERNHSSEDKVKCSLENAVLEDFMTNHFKTRPSPKFTECDTKDLGEWGVYDGSVSTWKGRPLLTFTDPLYMEDIMRRKPYQYVRKKIIRALKKLKIHYGKELSLEQIETTFKNEKLTRADFSYTGPMTSTNEYCMLEAFLGSYNTTIIIDSWDVEHDILKLKVTTENRSHWESAARFPGVLKQYGFPDYLFHNSLRDDDLKDEDTVELLQTPLYFLPMATAALDPAVALAGASTGVFYNKDDENSSVVHSAVKGTVISWGLYKSLGLIYVAHFKYGGTFIQRFEGEDTIQINRDLWCKEATVYFNLDESSLNGFRRDQALQILNDVIKEAKARNCKLKLEVRGYADTTGTESYNKSLSQKRADVITNYLGSKLVLEEASSMGYGESNLMVPSLPQSALNRRVEIWIEEVV